MFKTIFMKLIIVFIAILLISFTIAGVVLFSFLDNYVSNEQLKTFEKGGAQIINILTLYQNNLDNPRSASMLKQQIEYYSLSTNPYIWIINTEGEILFEPDIPDIIANKMAVSGNRYKLPDKRQYDEVIKEKKIIQEKGDLYGLFKDTGYSWLVIETPFIYNGKVKGVVYLSTPISEVKKTRTVVINFFLVSVAVSIFISIILVYIFSLRISRPLKQIKNAAKEIAGGEFQKRLNIKAKDEIGELAITFNNMAIALQNLEEMRRGFIANVSHELRTPMTSIRGFVEGILDGTIPPERQNNYLTIVREETIRLSRLVTDLLDLARMESGEITLSLRNFNITELIRRSIIKLESLIISKNIQIEANFEEENIQAFADVDAIERVIINLMHNAVKFSNEKGKIKISVEYFKDKILLTIEDNGIGIERDEIDLIWDRFYKSDKSRGKDKTGTGLGLAIIKSIINEHNQEIWVESELEVGTKFKFTLSKAEKSI